MYILRLCLVFLNLISENWLIRNDQYSLDRSLEKGKVKDKIEMFQLGG